MKPEAGQWLFCRKKLGATAKEYGLRVHEILPNCAIVAEVNPDEYELVSEKNLEGYEHEPRCTGWDWVVPDEDPDEWVIQNRVPVRRGIDRINWMENSVDTSREPFDLSIGKMHGYVNRHGKTLHVYCRCRDLPKVEQDKSDAGHDWSYHNQQKPQRKKTMLRLWVDSDCNIHAGLKGDRDLELHYDHETRQFYTEET